MNIKDVHTAVIYLWMFVFLLSNSGIAQTNQETGIVSEVTGTCWLIKTSGASKSEVKKGTTFAAGDTLQTTAEGRIKIIIWQGDQRKTIFGNTVFVAPEASVSPKKQTGVFGAAMNLIKEKYSELSSVVVESKSQGAAIKGLPSEPKTREIQNTNYTGEGLLLLFPRNENVLKKDIAFHWSSSFKNTKFIFQLFENDKSIIKNEITNNLLQPDYSFAPHKRYVWCVQSVAPDGKQYADSAFFCIISGDEETMIGKEIASLSVSGIALSPSQRLLIKPFVLSKWELYSKSILLYRNLLNQPYFEIDEIRNFMKSEFTKMAFPEDKKTFDDYIDWLGNKATFSEDK